MKLYRVRRRLSLTYLFSIILLLFCTLLYTYSIADRAKDKLSISANLAKDGLNLAISDVVITGKNEVITDASQIYKFFSLDGLSIDVNLISKDIEVFYIVEKDGKQFIARQKLSELISSRDILFYLTIFTAIFLFIFCFIKEKRRLDFIIAAFSSSHDAIFLTDESGVVEMVNDMFLKYTGFKESKIIGKKYFLFNPPRRSSDIEMEINENLKRLGFWQGEYHGRDSRGGDIPQILTIKKLPFRKSKYLGMFYCLTEYKKTINELRQIAYYDVLTGLPNRKYFESLLVENMKNSRSNYKNKIALLFMDFDGFKNLNDRYGHTVGDHYLRLISFAVNGALKQNDILARLSGDEFGVILLDVKDDVQLKSRIDKILVAGKSRFNISGHENVGTSLSIGAVTYPTADDIGFIELIKRADRAMYKAKQDGKDRFAIYKEIGFNTK